jgi:CRP-like cAMP-binding protein
MSLGIEALKTCELFDGCDDALLAEILADGRERTYHAGDVVYSEGAEHDEVYLVLEGRLLHTFAVLDAAGVDYDLAVEPGEISNEARFLSDEPSYVGCVADTDTKGIAWKVEDAVGFCNRHPEVGYPIMTSIARLLNRRFQQLNQVILDRVAWGLE